MKLRTMENFLEKGARIEECRPVWRSRVAQKSLKLETWVPISAYLLIHLLAHPCTRCVSCTSVYSCYLYRISSLPLTLNIFTNYERLPGFFFKNFTLFHSPAHALIFFHSFIKPSLITSAWSCLYKDFKILLGKGPILYLFLKTWQASAWVKNYFIDDY